MFLITTANQQFWRKDKPILFLGEWCKLFAEKNTWENLDYEVLPYHWDDRSKFYRDYCYLSQLYECSLEKLAQCLNMLHGVNNSLRYWRIIIGPWLNYFIAVLYDRFESIQNAVSWGKITSTYISAESPEKWCPKDYRSFFFWMMDDPYNHYLYSRIIEFLSIIPYELKEDRVKHIDHKVISSRGLRTSIQKYIIRSVNKLTPNKFKDVAIISARMKISDLVRISLSMAQFPDICWHLFKPTLPLDCHNIDLEKRKKINLELSTKCFERLLSIIICKQLPIAYVEGYHTIKSFAMDLYPKRPKVILSSTGHYFEEAFKVWAAEQAERGTKLVCIQHGGFYGTGRLSSEEDHEKAVFDKFFTWGWKVNGNHKVKPMHALFLNKIKEIKPSLNGRILLVENAIPRYFYRMFSAPIAASGMKRYFVDQFRFVSCLNDATRQLVTVRLYGEDYGNNQNLRWKSQFPDVEIYLGKETLVDQLKNCRLVVCSYNATAHLETLKANFPTILFWNPNEWELNENAKEYYNYMREVGILHGTPESAAALVNDIVDDPWVWWNQTNIQKCREKICEVYAFTDKNWPRAWKDELRHLMKSNGEKNFIEAG